MKRVSHFSSVVGREGKFDPFAARDITKFNAKPSPQDERQLDVAAAYRLIDRRVGCSTDIGGYNPRSPSPPRHRGTTTSPAPGAVSPDATGVPDGDEHGFDLSMESETQLKAKAAAEQAPPPLPEAFLNDAVLSTRRNRAAPTFPKAARRIAAATPHPSVADEAGRTTLPPISATPQPTASSSSPSVPKERTDFARAPGRSGFAPNNEGELKRLDERRRREQAEAEARMAAAEAHRAEMARQTRERAISAAVAGDSTLSLRRDGKMTTRDIATTIERHHACVDNHLDDGRNSRALLRGPLFRMDTGRDVPVMGVTQNGVDSTVADHDAANKPEPTQLDVERSYAALKRHEPRTSLKTAAREHDNAKIRRAMLERANAALKPERLQKVLQSEARRHREDAERVKSLREKRALDMSTKGRLVSRTDKKQDETSKALEADALAAAAFYASLDPRLDNADNAPPHVPKNTRLQRDMWLVADRDKESPSTLLAPMPHVKPTERPVVPAADAADADRDARGRVNAATVALLGEYLHVPAAAILRDSKADVDAPYVQLHDEDDGGGGDGGNNKKRGVRFASRDALQRSGRAVLAASALSMSRTTSNPSLSGSTVSVAGGFPQAPGAGDASVPRRTASIPELSRSVALRRQTCASLPSFAFAPKRPTDDDANSSTRTASLELSRRPELAKSIRVAVGPS